MSIVDEAERVKDGAPGLPPLDAMRAMVLAAGLGTRMRPLTDARPKPLVEVAGRPLIDHVLDRLAEARVPQAIVNVHHHADLLEAHLDARSTPAITLSDERDQLLETGGGVGRALPLLGPRPFLVLNSDAIWIEGAVPLLEQVHAAFDPARMDALLCVASTVTSCGYAGSGDFHMEPDGRLVRRQDGEIAAFVFIGVSMLVRELFDPLPEGPFSLNLVFDRAASAGRLFGIRLDGISMHVGTPASIAEAEACIAESVD